MKKTTVVIPNYNGAKYLKACLKALAVQTQPDFEIILVDNGSDDASLCYVSDCFSHVKVISLPKNFGFCKAVNEGILAAKTPFVLLLNNDTEAAPGFVEAMEQAIERSEHIFSVSAKMLMMDAPKKLDGAGDYYTLLGWAYARGKGKPKDSFMARKRIFSACGGAAIYRREIFHVIGMFDENHFAYLEDLDIGYRARIYGYENFYEPKAEVLHVGSGSSGARHNPFKTKLSAQNNIYVIYKNMPLLQLIINLPFLLLGFFIKMLYFYKKGLGKSYREGLAKGIAFCFTKEAKKHKVGFQKKHLFSYMKIEWELFCHIFRRI